jgi:hypothetical protein
MTRSGRPRVPSRSAGRESPHTRSRLEEVSHVVRSRTAPSIFDPPAKCVSTSRECYQEILDAAFGTRVIQLRAGSVQPLVCNTVVPREHLEMGSEIHSSSLRATLVRSYRRRRAH